MEVKILSDIGAIVALIVGVIVVTRAIKKSINDAITPHIKAINEAIAITKLRIDKLDDSILTVEQHSLMCDVSNTRIKDLEKALCSKIQMVINLIGIREHPRDGVRPFDGIN